MSLLKTTAIISATTCTFLLLIILNLPKNKEPATPTYVELPTKIPKQDKPDLAIEQEYEMTHNPKLGRVTPEKLIQIKSEIKKGTYESGLREDDEPWIERGPNNVGGRTRAVLFDKNDPSGNTVWAGGVSGGLWKSTNFLDDDVTWTVVDDFFPSIAIGAIAQDPGNHNLLYFGTGEGWFNGDAVRGLGIWKSEDSGASWSQLSSTNNSNFHYIQSIKIDEDGNLYASTRSAGLQKSVDGGSSWNRILGGGTVGGFSQRAADIEIARNGDIYVVLGIQATDGIYKSTDGGSSWASLNDNGLNNGLPTENYERIELAVAPSDPNMIYAVFQAEDDNGCLGIYRSEDGGVSWSDEDVPEAFGMDDFTRGQAWYDLTIAVDPNSANTVYLGGIDLLRSLDGGRTWKQLSQWYGGGGFQYVHADQHDIQFLEGNSFTGIAVNDGGIFHFDIPPVFEEGNFDDYCNPVHFNCCSDYIERVVLNDLINDSGSATSNTIEGYSDFTNQDAFLKAGESYDLEVFPNFTWDDSKFGAWIDYNHNEIFEEEENITSISGQGPYFVNFEVPQSAIHGDTRMRLRLQFSPDYTPHPCDGAFTMGETEDYTVTIENCFLGNGCNDNDPCTENDVLDDFCNCRGTLIDIDGDGNCDLINEPTFAFKSHDYNVTQFYSCAIHPEENSNVLLGGTQDNGTQYFSDAGLGATIQVTGGDGGFCFIDQNEPEIQISSYIYNDYFITTDGWSSLNDEVEIGDSKGRFINPVDYDSESNTLVGAYDDGYISRIRNVGSTNIYDTLKVEELGGMKVSAVKVNPHIPNSVWVGTPKDFLSNVSRIVLLTEVDKEEPIVSKVITIANEFFGSAYLSCIEVSDQDPDHMVIVFSNYGVPSIWRTIDGGENWVNVEGNLPDMPIRWIVIDPFNENGGIIATEMGVWQTNNFDGDDTQWTTLNTGLANVKCSMLKFRESDNTFVVATYGRGLFTQKYCSNETFLTEAICVGESYEFFGEEISEAGQYTKDVADEESCSGFTRYVLDLDVLDTMIMDVDLDICFGTSTTFKEEEFSETGTYLFTETADNVCGALITRFNLTVRDLLTVELGDSIFINLTDGFVIETDRPFSSYLWSDGSTSSTLEVDGEELGAGTYHFSVLVTDDIGCEAEDDIVIVVLDPSNTIDLSSNELLAFPNPTVDILNLKIPDYFQGIKLNIYTVEGKRIKSIPVSAGLMQINVEGLDPGSYFIVGRGERGRISCKFLKI